MSKHKEPFWKRHFVAIMVLSIVSAFVLGVFSCWLTFAHLGGN